MKILPYSLITLILSSISCNTFAFDNPYAELPVERVKSTIVQTFPRFTFLEDVAIDNSGSIYASNHLEGKIYQIKNNKVSTLLDIEGELLCMTQLDDDNLIITGRDTRHQQYIHQLNTDGTHKVITHLADAEFLNGIATLDKENVLVADSYKGVIWKVNVRKACYMASKPII